MVKLLSMLWRFITFLFAVMGIGMCIAIPIIILLNFMYRMSTNERKK